MSMATISHLLTELVNQGALPLGVLTLAAPYLRKGKYVTKYRQVEAEPVLQQGDCDEDSEESGYMEEEPEDMEG